MEQRSVTAPRRALSTLTALRHRLKRAFVADGVVTLLQAALIAFAASFLADYFLRLPWGVRSLLLLVGIGFGAAAIIRRIMKPLALELPDDEMAVLIERSHPELGQGLLTAIELTRIGSETSRYVSTQLLDSVVKDAEQKIAQARLDRVFDLRRLFRKSVALFLMAVVCGFIIGQQPGLAGVWLRRNLFLSNAAWPKLTQLELTVPSESPAVVAMGDDLPVAVRVVRGTASMVVVQSVSEQGVERIDSMAESTDALFQKTFANVSRPFEFWVEGGDDRIGPFAVEVRLRPRIDMRSLSVWYEYPEYLGMPPTPEDEPVPFGNVKVPVGTKVRFRMAANVPIRSAHLVVETGETGTGVGSSGDGDEQSTPSEGSDFSDEWPAAGATELAIEDNQWFGGEFLVDGSGSYFIQLETLDAFRSTKPDKFRVEAIPDRPPMANIVTPDQLTEKVTATAVVTIEVSGSDDYGVAGGTVEGKYFVAGEVELDADRPEDSEAPAGIVRSQPLQEKRPSAIGDGNALERALDVGLAQGRSRKFVAGLRESLVHLIGEESPKPTPGARFNFHVELRDRADNVGVSTPRFLEVVSPEDLELDLNTSLMVVRDRLVDLREQQESTRQDVETFQDEVRVQGQLVSKEAHKLFRYEREQEKISLGLQREHLTVARILQRAADNQVGDKRWRDWVGGVHEGLEVLGNEKAHEIAQFIEKLRKAAAQEPQELAQLQGIVSRQLSLENNLDMLILEISEFGELNAILQQWRDIKRRQQRLRNSTRLLLEEGSP